MRHRVVVHGRRRPWLWVAAGAVALVALLGSAYGGYRYAALADGSLFADPASELDRLRDERRRLTRELRATRDALDAIRGKGTFDARSCEIDAQACEAVRGNLRTLEGEVAVLREQLAFYRNIVAPDQARAGVRVQKVELRPGKKSGAWHYDLTLVQPARRDRVASGTFGLAVEGQPGKAAKPQRLDGLGAGAPVSQPFEFRTFQEFSGDLSLPPGFLPSRLAVTLRVQDGPKDTVQFEETFEWARLAGAN